MSGGVHALVADLTAIAAKSANYQMVATDRTILATGSITVTLPVTPTTGQTYTVKNIGTGTVTVAPPANNIDGSATISLTQQYQSVTVISDGIYWYTAVKVTSSSPAPVAKTANYTMTATDGPILASNTITITLPPVATASGRYTVKNIGTGTITVAPASGTIDGAANQTMTVQYSSLDFVTDGTNWYTV